MKWLSAIISVTILSVGWAAPVLFADDSSLRLPGTTVPIHYELTIDARKVHTVERNYSGSVLIYVDVVNDTDTITLHNRELDIETLIVTRTYPTRDILEHELEYDIPKDFMHVHIISESLFEGDKLEIVIEFKGQLRLDMTGFYKSSYKVDNTVR